MEDGRPHAHGAGFILGVLVGRWSTSPRRWGLRCGSITSEVEVPGWFLGLMYGVIGCRSIATGIAVRRAIHRLSRTTL